MLKIIGFFFFNPVFLVAICVIAISGYRRIQQERRQFSIAIDSHFLEARSFFKDGLFGGLIASVVSLLLGIVVDNNWLVWYVLITLLGLVCFTAFWDNGILWLLVAGLAWFKPNLVLPGFFNDTIIAPVQGAVIPSALAIAALGLGACGCLFQKMPQLELSPKIKNAVRGGREAYYAVQRLYLMPLILLVPGDAFPMLKGWWPFFNLGNQRFTILVLPLILGLNLKLKRRLPAELTQLKRPFMLASVIMLALAFLGLKGQLPGLSLILGAIVVIFLRGYVARFLAKGNSHLLQPKAGIQVLAVQQGTPAQKAGLTAGDVVLSANGQPVNSQAQFYEVIQASATFVSLRVKTLHQDIKLAETAIYKDSPHELGIITFPDSEQTHQRRI
ncbi:MAG: PDZ domain-containing protein [Lactobacillus sp.]|nr:PDZ domain-containing protein [Lactobacillus sp.]